MIDRLSCANAVRVLSFDAIEKAKSGHPGAPMGMADIAQVVWRDHLKHNPNNPDWHNRDRFVLSNGHGSMLLYALLHLSGYDVSIGDLRQFRQLHSKTPGHPEYGYADGVETTTGPLGQGLANAVGMALAERCLAAQFNRPEHEIIDHYTWVFVGDGCLMEGISHEVCSLAGTLGLGKLVVIWDDNNISIDGEVGGWFGEDVAKRFEAYGWQVIHDVDGHNPSAIEAAIVEAKSDVNRPSVICAKTIIGKGSPNKAGTAGVHGAPLGADERALTCEALGWKHEPFEVPQSIYDAWDCRAKGAEMEQLWDMAWQKYAAEHSQLADQLQRRLQAELPSDWQQKMYAYISETQQAGEKLATRQSSQKAIEKMASILPELFGGSADLGHSNLTVWEGHKPVCDYADGNYVNYGVREFGMSAMLNGVALHGGFVPFGGTFLMFMEYARNAVRMAALMKQRSIFVYTHDSIGLGEDGPTHQPVEQIESMRCVPNLSVWRPCDGVESAVAWKYAVERKIGPTALCFSRQAVPAQQRNTKQLSDVEKGGYVLHDGTDVIIIATGSEVAIAMDAAEQLQQKGISARVVSMPSQDVFDAQSAAYKQSVLPDAMIKRISVEAGVTRGWSRYVGTNGISIGVDTFGESAPMADLYQHFGLTVDAVVRAAAY